MVIVIGNSESLKYECYRNCNCLALSTMRCCSCIHRLASGHGPLEVAAFTRHVIPKWTRKQHVYAWSDFEKRCTCTVNNRWRCGTKSRENRGHPPSPTRAPSTLRHDKPTNPDSAGGEPSDLETGAGRKLRSPARSDLATGDVSNLASAPPDGIRESSSECHPLGHQERNASGDVTNQSSTSW